MYKVVNNLKRIPNDIKRILEYKKLIEYQNKNYHVNGGECLKKFKGIGEGKKCFIIGNGPSLEIEDLEAIKDEITFASNGIFGIFDKTNWRPTYYFLGDENYASYIGDNIINPIASSEYSFLIYTHLEKYSKKVLDFDNVYFYNQPYRTIFEGIGDKVFRRNKPRFSDDITKAVFSAGTITYEMLQIAVYMKFDEIYLIGIDHSYANGSHFKGCDDMYKEGPSKLLKWEYGYKMIKEQADSRGIKIFNATRGGHLEVFQRIELDKVK